ncbi:MAG: hypothetical protein KDA17_02145 [Candidatus Saccharibacteria bacterium]|nr:hypothetical protein [Candidatus Saccharibacteria bacterium]
MGALNVIPTSFYIIAGTLILANVGTVVTVFYGIGKLVWWLAKLDSRVSVVEVEHTKDIDSAHIKIRDLEKLNYNNKGT